VRRDAARLALPTRRCRQWPSHPPPAPPPRTSIFLPTGNRYPPTPHPRLYRAPVPVLSQPPPKQAAQPQPGHHSGSLSIVARVPLRPPTSARLPRGGQSRRRPQCGGDAPAGRSTGHRRGAFTRDHGRRHGATGGPPCHQRGAPARRCPAPQRAASTARSASTARRFDHPPPRRRAVHACSGSGRHPPHERRCRCGGSALDGGGGSPSGSSHPTLEADASPPPPDAPPSSADAPDAGAGTR